ncbi:LacI family DNA-binding transcriptional regulator [Marinicrinis sediminis]|uniref:LacI family DNA-binding transcriptional regulator n=1 Tax=Marinicrinis sediminis TaxID=1652465 RepID=A0ABW5R9U2_9BACL
MKVTINDIAKAAGVSKSTVSKVMNDSPTISEATKRKVREIMKQMNYTPSSIATQLARQSSFNIGLVVDMSRQNDFLNHDFYNIMGGLESVIASHHYELTICNIGNLETSDFFARYIYNKRVDGIVLDNSILTQEMASELLELSFPFVSLGELDGRDDIFSVDLDNRTGGSMLTQHLIDQGYKRIAFLGGERADRIFQNRIKGYKKTFAEHQLPVQEKWIRTGFSNEENGRAFIRHLLEQDERPDAFICMNNNVAFGALQTIVAAGIKVPEEMGIATFDNYPLAPYTTPPLTCLNTDTFQLGIDAGQMLMSQLHQQKSVAAPHQSFISPVLIERESTRLNQIARP